MRPVDAWQPDTVTGCAPEPWERVVYMVECALKKFVESTLL